MQIEVSHAPVFTITLTDMEMIMLKSILREAIKTRTDCIDIDSGEREWAEEFLKYTSRF